MAAFQSRRRPSILPQPIETTYATTNEPGLGDAQQKDSGRLFHPLKQFPGNAMREAQKTENYVTKNAFPSSVMRNWLPS